MQVEKFSNSLQKVVCPSCQSTHHFGATQDITDAQVPTIEKVSNQNSKMQSLDPKFDQRTIDQEIFWRCGVCESSYHFNLNRVTTQGIKVTCTTCFSFFILQKVGVMVDLDHMVMQEVSADKVLPSQFSPEERGFLPPEIDASEVSGRFNLNTLQEALAQEEAKAAFEKKEDTVKTEIKPQPVFETTNVQAPTPPVAPKTNPYIQQPGFRTSPGTSTNLSDQKVEIKANDANWINSFKSFNTQKKDFKFSPVEVSTEFVEHNPKRKPNFIEKNLTKISLWVAGFCVFCLIVVFAYDWYESTKKKPEPVAEPAPQEQQQEAPADNTKPRYGFPTLDE